jgi:hypothetical protein
MGGGLEVMTYDDSKTGWQLISTIIERSSNQQPIWKLLTRINEVKNKYRDIINETNHSPKKVTFRNYFSE